MFESKEESVASIDDVLNQLDPVKNLPLPSDFIWGTATASYQIEGGAFQDGKGPSIWDEFSHREPSVTSNDHGDVACDSYNRLSEDIALLASYGVDAYRFSICWSRLIPLGGRNDPVEEKGIAYYNRLIDGLLARGIKPAVTLYHWDLPLELHKRYGGMLNTDEFQADFENYARLCFSRFGDRVKTWITFNEPYIVSIFGYHSGILAPGHNTTNGNDSRTEPWRVGHSLIMGHASAVETYVNDFQPSQKGDISIVLNGEFYEPYDESSEADKKAVQRRLEFYMGWFGDPIYLGADYPACMREGLGSRLPQFSASQQKLLKKTAPYNTFYGMNHYTSQFVRARTEAPSKDDHNGNVEELSTNSKGEELGPLSGVTWLRVTHHQFRKLLNWAWDRYQRPIYITENGCPCPGENSMTLQQAVNDDFRTRYFGLYLDAISQAIYEDGVKVAGYYAWSLMDNFGTYHGY